MNWETATALRWTEILVSLAVGLQTLELLWLQLRTPLAEIWNWPDLTVEMRMPKIISSISTALYSRVGFSILLSLQFIIALFLTVAPSHQAPWMLLATAVLVNGRWRGTFNGGSDSMTFVVLLGTCFSHLGEGDNLATYGLTYIGIQVILSYFVAGCAKVKNPDWWSGKELQRYILFSNYQAPPVLKQIFQSQTMSKILSRSTIIWEVLFPLVLFFPSMTWVFLPVGLGFHLALTWVFGLNRFFWAWLASYPALLWFITHHDWL